MSLNSLPIYVIYLLSQRNHLSLNVEEEWALENVEEVLGCKNLLFWGLWWSFECFDRLMVDV